MGANVWGLRIGAQSEAREGRAKTRNSLKSTQPHRNPATAQCSGGGHAEMPQVYCFPATICNGVGFKSVVLLCAFDRGGVVDFRNFV